MLKFLKRSKKFKTSVIKEDNITTITSDNMRATIFFNDNCKNYEYHLYFKSKVETVVSFYSLSYSKTLVIGLLEYFNHLAEQFNTLGDNVKDIILPFMDKVELRFNVIDVNSMSDHVKRREDYISLNKDKKFDPVMIARVLIYSSQYSRDLSDERINYLLLHFFNAQRISPKRRSTVRANVDDIYNIELNVVVMPIFYDYSVHNLAHLFSDLASSSVKNILPSLHNKDDVDLYTRLDFITSYRNNYDVETLIKDIDLNVTPKDYEFSYDYTIKNMYEYGNYFDDLSEKTKYLDFMNNLTVNEFYYIKDILFLFKEVNSAVCIQLFNKILKNKDTYILESREKYDTKLQLTSYLDYFNKENIMDVDFALKDFIKDCKKNDAFVYQCFLWFYNKYRKIKEDDVLVDEIISFLEIFNFKSDRKHIFSMIVNVMVLSEHYDFEQTLEFLKEIYNVEGLTVDKLLKYFDNEEEYSAISPAWWVELV